MQSLHDVFRHVGFLSMVLAALVCSRSPRAQTKTCAETKDNPASAGTTDVQPITPVLYSPASGQYRITTHGNRRGQSRSINGSCDIYSLR